MKLFSLKGASGVAEISVDKAGSKVIRDLREAMAAREIPGTVAERLIDDLLVTALTRIGRNFETAKGAHIDTVLRLRGELDALFVDIFMSERAGTKAQINAALDARLPSINAHYAELEKALAQATLPLDRMTLVAELDNTAVKAVSEVPAANLPHTERPVSADQAIESGSGISRMERKVRGGQKGKLKDFEALADGGFKVSIDSGETVLRIVDGRYHAEIYPPPGMSSGREPVRVSEFQVSIDPYGTRLAATALLQRNHVVQNAPMEALFGTLGYDGNKFPTMWLRNSKTGSPHGRVTSNQRHAKTEMGNAFQNTNLGDLQRRGIAEMRALGASDADIAQYMSRWDAQFRQDVLPRIQQSNLSPQQVKALLGDWDPVKGLVR